MSSAPLASQDQMARASVPMSDTDIANMLTWSNEQVCHWLQSVGLGDKFEKHFVAHEITGDVLPLLQLAELKDMFVSEYDLKPSGSFLSKMCMRPWIRRLLVFAPRGRLGKFT